MGAIQRGKRGRGKMREMIDGCDRKERKGYRKETEGGGVSERRAEREKVNMQEEKRIEKASILHIART